MRKIDVDMLTNEEAQIVDDSFDRGGLPSRFRNIILGAFLATAVALTLLALEASAGTVAAALIIFVAIASLEKISYVRTQMNSRGAIRKLVHRIEALEGVPSTPDDAKPTRLALERDTRAA